MKKYEKELDYSYTLGIFPTIELINNAPGLVIKIILSNDISDIKYKIIDFCKNNNIEYVYDDKFISKVSEKENCYVIGIFKKENNKITRGNHVVLVNPSNMGNVGTIIRTMVGFNYKDLVIITPAVDMFNPKLIRSSMGAIFNINFELFSSFEEYRLKYKNQNIYTFMLDGKQSISNVIKKEPYSLVFGNESSGLDNSYIKYNSVVIPHNNKIDSLNLTIAIGIALYEFTR